LFDVQSLFASEGTQSVKYSSSLEAFPRIDNSRRGSQVRFTHKEAICAAAVARRRIERQEFRMHNNMSDVLVTAQPSQNKYGMTPIQASPVSYAQHAPADD
jgi:hypothetical protein